MWSSVILYLLLDCPLSPLTLPTSFVCAAALSKPDAIPKGRLQSLQTNPAPAKKAQSEEILLYLYSRGKVCWHCSKALFNLLQSDRGSREPSSHNAAPQLCWRCYVYLHWRECCVLSFLPGCTCLSHNNTPTVPALQRRQERLGICFPSAAHLLHPPLTHLSSLLSQTGLLVSVKLNTCLENDASALITIYLYHRTLNQTQQWEKRKLLMNNKNKDWV